MASEDGSTYLIVFIAIVGLFLAGLLAYMIYNTRETQASLISAEEYIRRANANAESNNVNGFDLETMRQYMEDAYAAACVIAPEPDGTCRVGSTKNTTTGCCELNDPEVMSKFEKGLKMTETIIQSVFIGYMIEKFVSVANRITGLTVRATYSKVATSAGRVAAKSSARITMRTALKMGAKIASKPVAWAGGPLAFMWLAFEAWSLYLDIKDPRGYTKLYQPIEVITRLRNSLDVVMQQKLSETTEDELRLDYPQCFPLSIAYPEYDEEFQIKYFSQFLPNALSAMSDEEQGMVANLFIQALTNDRESTEEEDDAAALALQTAFETYTSANYMLRDEFIYEFYKNRLGPNLITHTKSLSSPRRIAVTLSKMGADVYNRKNESDHVRYSDLTKQDENNVPESYSPYVAVYTNKYRELDTSLASFENYDDQNIPMIEKTLQEYTTLMLPYGALVSACIKGTVTRGEEIIRPGVYGVTYNYDTSTCNYTGSYCQRFGLDYDGNKNECVKYPGQDEAEFVFGTTVTRDTIRTANWFGGFFEGLFTGKGGL